MTSSSINTSDEVVSTADLPNISRSEWLWAGLISALILLLTSVPYLAAYLSQTPESVFNGAVYDRPDYAVHLATMQLGARGEWKYRFLFTSEAHQGAYVKLGYIALGHVADRLGMSMPLAYQAARIAFGLVACLAIYLLLAFSFREVFWRRAGFLLAVLGSGIGWLQLILGKLPVADISPIDFWLIDGYVFFSLLTFPHFALTIAMVVGMICAYLAYLRKRSTGIWALAAGLGVMMQWVQPYAPLLADLAIFGIILAHCGLQKRKIQRELVGMLALGLSQTPLVLYNAWVFQSSAVWIGFVSQNTTLSPPAEYYLWGYLFFWSFSCLGFWRLLSDLKAQKSGNSDDNVTVVSGATAWIAGAMLLAFLPTNLQRRFTLGLTVPLAILSTYGLKALGSGFSVNHRRFWIEKKLRLLMVLLVGLSSVSSFALSYGAVRLAILRDEELYEPATLIAAIEWLGSQSQADEVVLCAERTGQLIAARLGLPVYLGHPIETIDYPVKLKKVQEVFVGERTARSFMSDGVHWVFWGPYESRMANGIDLFGELEMVYHNRDVKIFELKP